jgi:hypothetical protein
MNIILNFLKTLSEKVGISLLATTIKDLILKLFKKDKKKRTFEPKKQASSSNVSEKRVTKFTINTPYFKYTNSKTTEKNTKNNSKK